MHTVPPYYISHPSIPIVKVFFVSGYPRYMWGGPADDLASPAQAQHQVQRALLLDVVVRERAAVLELLAREDEALLVGRDALLVLDLRLHVLDRVAGLHVERDGLARERLDENLHPAAQPQHQVQRALLLDVVVRKRAAVLELLAGEDEALLVGRDALPM